MYSVLRLGKTYGKECFLKANTFQKMPSCADHFVWEFIKSKKLRDPNYERPLPFDYRNKSYWGPMALFDKTSHRFDENTKLIVVEGSFGVGKTELAKQLAEALDFHFQEDPSVDEAATTVEGIDSRNYEWMLPPRFQFLDREHFFRNPYDSRVHEMQHKWFLTRIRSYLRALRHIYNTGQGVVMNRSCYSYHALVGAMLKCGFVSKRYTAYVDDLRWLFFPYLKRPHLQIYLEAPYEVCMERIREKNIPYMAESKFFSEKLHNEMDIQLKSYFEVASDNSSLLMYDWTNKQDVDDIVMDIESMPFHPYDHMDTKNNDWMMVDESQFTAYRTLITVTPYKIFEEIRKCPPLEVPELCKNSDEAKQLRMLGNKLLPELLPPQGFNKYLGDSYLFAFDDKYRQYPYRDPLHYGIERIAYDLI